MCLIKIKKLPDIGVSNGDKIFHCLSYTLLSFLWFNTLRYRFQIKKLSALLYAAVASIIFGIVIEVLQGTLTTSRAADVYDVLANTLGVFITILLVFITLNIPIKKY